MVRGKNYKNKHDPFSSLSHRYDGYRLTPLGYDYLALRALASGGHVAGVGRPIGVGKESDVFEVTTPDGTRAALKLHRLGRTSFRAVANKRDYVGTRTSHSWLYLSRIAAAREAAFMAALSAAGFPVPSLLAVNRHAVLMTAVDGVPLHKARPDDVPDPAALWASASGLLEALAARGLVHADFNEFNLLLSPDGTSLTLIDFPQMVAATHTSARDLFEHDAATLATFFASKLGFDPTDTLASFDAARARAAPAPKDGGRSARKAARRDAGDGAGGGAAATAAAVAAAAATAAGEGGDLATALAASGFRRKDEAALEAVLRGGGGGESGEGEESEESGRDDDDDDDDDDNDDDDDDDDNDDDDDDDDCESSDAPSSSSSSASTASDTPSSLAVDVAACSLDNSAPADAPPAVPPPPTPDRRAAVAARVAAEARTAAKVRATAGAARGAARATSKAKRKGTRGEAKA